MDGKIVFETLVQLADFLKEFSGATDTFEVYRNGNVWILKFTGGF